MGDYIQSAHCDSRVRLGAGSGVFVFGGPGSAPRRDDLRHTDYRLNGGAKGVIAEGWRYDAGVLFSQTVLDENYQNDLDLTKGARGLQVVNVNGVPTCKSVIDGTDPNCVPVDVFAFNGISPAAYKYIFTPTFTHGVQQERVISGSVNGDLGHYNVKSPFASSGVEVVLGAEHRAEDLSFVADAVALSKGTTDNAGRFSVNEAFSEIDVPLVNDAPFVKSLSVNGGYRYSKYTVDGGSTFKANTYKFELQYSPIVALKFRGSYNRAVRAPNVTELFQPHSVGNVAAQDPCSGPAPIASLENCQRTGVTAAQYGHIIACPADTCDTLFGGNLALNPEVADTTTFGLAFTPESAPGLSISADYFNIFVNHYIGPVDAPTVINQCVQLDSPYFCSLFHRDPATGILFGTNGYIVATNQNTGYLQTSGLDLTPNYRVNVGDLLFGALRDANWGKVQWH